MAIPLLEGQTLTAELEADEPETQDLDLFLYGTDAKTNLTPCCDPANGQSATGSERLTYAVNAGGTYYLLVRGYMGAAGGYLLSIKRD